MAVEICKMGKDAAQIDELINRAQQVVLRHMDHSSSLWAIDVKGNKMLQRTVRLDIGCDASNSP